LDKTKQKQQKGEKMKLLNTSDMYILLAAVASMGISIGYWFSGYQDAGLFIGMWVPSILGFGIYVKMLMNNKKR